MATFYKTKNGTFVNTQYADPSLIGSKVYSEQEAGVASSTPTSTTTPTTTSASIDTSSVQSLRNQIANGSMTPDQALQAIINADQQAQLAKGKGYSSPTTAQLSDIKSQLFAPMTVNQGGQVGQLNPDGTVTKTGATVNQSSTSAGGGTTSSSTQQAGQNTYQYVKSDGSIGTIQAPDAATAQKTAQGIAPNSGVQLTQSATSSTSGITAPGATASTNPLKATFGAIADVAANLTANGKPPVSYAEALAAAQNDPNIVASYADALKIDTNTFQQSLQQLQDATKTNDQAYQTQFENERKALAEKTAAAGQAYSGFRNKAQQDLSQSESGIVQSSRAGINKNLQDLTTAFEAKYGTAATTPASISYTDPLANLSIDPSGRSITPTAGDQTLTGTAIGGITGSQPINKSTDITNKAQNLYNLGALPA